jgi:hypothetical protein
VSRARAVNDVGPWSIVVMLPESLPCHDGPKLLHLAVAQIARANEAMNAVRERPSRGVAARHVVDWWESSPVVNTRPSV